MAVAPDSWTSRGGEREIGSQGPPTWRIDRVSIDITMATTEKKENFGAARKLAILGNELVERDLLDMPRTGLSIDAQNDSVAQGFWLDGMSPEGFLENEVAKGQKSFGKAALTRAGYSTSKIGSDASAEEILGIVRMALGEHAVDTVKASANAKAAKVLSDRREQARSAHRRDTVFIKVRDLKREIADLTAKAETAKADHEVIREIMKADKTAESVRRLRAAQRDLSAIEKAIADAEEAAALEVATA